MRVLLSVFFCAMFLGACVTNTTTSKYTGIDPRTGTKIQLELPKDIKAKGVDIRTSSGARIKIQELESTGNPEITRAQGKREKDNIDAVGTVVEKVSEGVAKGAVKGVKGGL